MNIAIKQIEAERVLSQSGIEGEDELDNLHPAGDTSYKGGAAATPYRYQGGGQASPYQQV